MKLLSPKLLLQLPNLWCCSYPTYGEIVAVHSALLNRTSQQPHHSDANYKLGHRHVAAPQQSGGPAGLLLCARMGQMRW